MNLKFPDEISKRATECPKNHSCLSNQEGGRCRVDYSMEGVPFLMLKKSSDEHCPYSFDFGNSYFCTCPVRRELYKRYSI
jgi:hypothetical protein